MKKILTKLLVITLISTTLFAGCASSATGQTKDGKTKIRFASWDSAESLDKQQQLVENFNTSQDKIYVTLEAYGAEFDTKISAGMGSGDTPDVMYMWNYPAYYKALEPLTSYIQAEGEDYKSKFYDALWSYNSIDSIEYGIPVGFTTHSLFYNKDIFDKAGIAYPTSDWTWDDLRDTAKKISETVENVKGFSYQMKPDPYDYEMYLWSNDATYVDENGSLSEKLNAEKSTEVFEFFQQMQKDGIAVATEGSGTDDMRGGKIAMYINGSWPIQSFLEDNLNFGIVEIPAFANAGKDSVSILSSSGMAMSKNSKNKEAAWEFIKYWTNEQSNQSRIGYELPVLTSVVESENIMQDPYKAPFYKMLEQSDGYVPACFITQNWSKVSENLSLSFERIFNPSALENPKKVLDEAVSE